MALLFPWHTLERQVRVDFDAARVSVDQMKDILRDEDYPVESVA